MGIFSKLKFWKKEDDDFGDLGLGKDELEGDPFAGGKDPFAMENQFPEIGGGATQQQAVQPVQTQPAVASQQTRMQAPGFRSGYAQQGMQQPYGQAMDQPDFNRPFTVNLNPQPSVQQASNYTVAKDIEVISSKLDALRASMDIINQRLSNLERMTEREQVRKRTGW